MERYDVFINGCGTVGRPLAKKLYDLGFRKVLLSVKSVGKNEAQVLEKIKFAHLVKETNFDVLIAQGGDPPESFRRYGIEPLGYVEEYIFEHNVQIGVIVDGTPNKKTAQTQKEILYDKINAEKMVTPVIFSGGSEFGIAPNYLGIPHASGDIYRERFLNEGWARNVSCNATFIGTELVLTGQAIDWDDVAFINTFLHRRSADPHETYKPLGLGVSVELPNVKKDEDLLTKYVHDVREVYPPVKKIPFTAIPTKNPWRHFHYIQTLITFKNSIRSADVEEIREVFQKFPLSILLNLRKIKMDRLVEVTASLGIPNAQITTPLYRVTRLNSHQLLIDGFTPQQLIDGPSKAVFIVEHLKKFSTFQQSFEFVVNGITEGGMPLLEFNKELQNRIETYNGNS